MKSFFIKLMVVIFVVFATKSCILGQYYSTLSIYDYSCAVNIGSIFKNGHLYVNGMVCDTAPPYQTRNVFAEVDVNTGNPIWAKTYVHPTFQSEFWYNGFIETPYNNGFATTGALNYGESAIVLFYDSTGSAINTVELVDTSTIFMYGHDLIYHNGAIYCLGVRQEANYDANLFVYKLDTIGNIIWNRKFGINSQTEIGGCLISYGDDILIGGARSNLLQVPYTVENQSHTWIFSIDTAGLVLDEWLDPDNKSFWPNDMLIAPNGNLVYVGAYRGNYIWSNWNDILLLGYAAELDLNTGIQSWEWTNGSYSPVTYLNDIKDKGTGYVITGTNYQSKGWIMITDYDGNINWNRKYYGMDTIHPYSWSTLMETQIMPNGNLVSVGNALNFLDNDDQQQYGWILGTDTTACLTCYLYGLDELQHEERISIYPNPFHNDLNVKSLNNLEILKISMVDMIGKSVYEYEFAEPSKFANLNLEWLVPGQYIIRIQYTNGVFSSNKVVKQ